MEDVGEDDGQGAGVEAGVKLLVLSEDQRGGCDAPDGLDVHREIAGVGAEVAQQVDVIAMGEDGADPGQDQQPKPIEAFQVEEGPIGQRRVREMAAEQREQEQQSQTRAEHFPSDHRLRSELVFAVDDPAVQHREDRRKKRAQQGNSEAQPFAALKAHDHGQPDHDQQSEGDFQRSDRTLFEDRFGERGEQRDRCQAGEGDRDVGELDRAEEAEPVQPDNPADT